MELAAVELTTVALPVMAVAPEGMPLWPAIVKVRGTPADSLPLRPMPLRVSSTRTGVTGWYLLGTPAATGVTAADGAEAGPVPPALIAATVI